LAILVRSLIAFALLFLSDLYFLIAHETRLDRNRIMYEFMHLPVEQQYDYLLNQIKNMVNDTLKQYEQTKKKVTLPLPENWNTLVNEWCSVPHLMDSLFKEFSILLNQTGAINVIDSQACVEFLLRLLEGGLCRDNPNKMVPEIFKSFIHYFQTKHYNQQMFERFMDCMQLANINVFKDPECIRIINTCEDNFQMTLRECKDVIPSEDDRFLEKLDGHRQLLAEIEKRKEVDMRKLSFFANAQKGNESKFFDNDLMSSDRFNDVMNNI
ncbi:hypothetical protein, partial [Legionella sp. W05-934-2]|uniref:hypothetical protein n=1 Tax=Legionella sp. W05-934-2 TaxID=1198649 RepID=UPI003461BEBF